METGRPDSSSSGIIRSYEDLRVYQLGMNLLKPVHDLALKLPRYETYDLASQIRRACKSVPTNIAEGYAKKRSAKEFRAYLATAMGSANEVVVHLKVAIRLEYLTADECAPIIEQYQALGKQLHRLIDRWRSIDLQPPASNLQQLREEEAEYEV